MSARNMVRSLRDSGALAVAAPAPGWRATLVSLAGGLALGAGVYLGALYGLPALGTMLEKPPMADSFARPGGD